VGDKITPKMDEKKKENLSHKIIVKKIKNHKCFVSELVEV